MYVMTVQDTDDSHTGWAGRTFHHDSQNAVQLKTYKLFVFGIFHPIFPHLS